MVKQPHLDDCREVLLSWNRCHGAFYRVSENDLRWNLTEQSFVRYSAAELAGIPVLLGEATSSGAATGILEKGIWVSLYGEIPAGGEEAFAAAAEQHARKAGKTRVAIGADEFHFLPGIPVNEPSGERLAKAFRAQGFSSRGCADYVGSPQGTACVSYVKSAREDAAKRSWSLRLVESARDRELLSEHLKSEFMGRWYREWIFQNARKDTGRAFWNLLRDESDRVIGFSRLAVRSRIADSASGWTPGAMRLAPSEEGFRNTDSCLGPIGVAKAERGRGAGKILLGLSIHELSLQGAERTCIDWTDAYNYYTPLEFSVPRRFQCIWKEL